MSITQNKKNGARFNFFDVLLILAVLGCITGLVLHIYFTKDLNETYSEEAKIILEVTDISENTAAALQNLNTSIYLDEQDTMLGTVVDASLSPMRVELENAEGILVTTEHPAKKTATLTTLMTGTWTEDGFLIAGNTPAVIGKTIKIYTQYAVCTVTITSVAPKDAQ